VGNYRGTQKGTPGLCEPTPKKGFKEKKTKLWRARKFPNLAKTPGETLKIPPKFKPL